MKNWVAEGIASDVNDFTKHQDFGPKIHTINESSSKIGHDIIK